MILHWPQINLIISLFRRSDSGARARIKANERAGKKTRGDCSFARFNFPALALHYLNAWNRLPNYLIPIYRVVLPLKNIAVTVEKYLPQFPFLWRPMQFFFLGGNCSSSLLLNFDNSFLWLTGKCDRTNRYANILSHEDIKACSWCQVRQVNFTCVLIVLCFRQTDLLDSAVSPFACR